jgi:hypothetical protein
MSSIDPLAGASAIAPPCFTGEVVSLLRASIDPLGSAIAPPCFTDEIVSLLRASTTTACGSFCRRLLESLQKQMRSSCKTSLCVQLQQGAWFPFYDRRSS